MTFGYGVANSNWVPLAGDWNGSGVTTVGLYAPGSSTFYLRDSNTSGIANATIRLAVSGCRLDPGHRRLDRLTLSASTNAAAPLSTAPTTLSIDQATPAAVGWWLSAGLHWGISSAVDGYFAASSGGDRQVHGERPYHPRNAARGNRPAGRRQHRSELVGNRRGAARRQLENLDWSPLGGGPVGSSDLPEEHSAHRCGVRRRGSDWLGCWHTWSRSAYRRVAGRDAAQALSAVPR